MLFLGNSVTFFMCSMICMNQIHYYIVQIVSLVILLHARMVLYRKATRILVCDRQHALCSQPMLAHMRVLQI